jgi:hypothetical protein
LLEVAEYRTQSAGFVINGVHFSVSAVGLLPKTYYEGMYNEN